MPAENAPNTTQQPPIELNTIPAGRDENGRFAENNPGGPGNPFARQVAHLRRALLNGVTADDMNATGQMLVAKSRGGDLAATKLLLQYTVGKPAPAVEPDHLDVDEWQQLEQEATMMAKLLRGMWDTPHPTVPLYAMRALRGANGKHLATYLVDGIHEARAKAQEGQSEPGSDKPRLPNGKMRRAQRRLRKRLRSGKNPYYEGTAEPAPLPAGS